MVEKNSYRVRATQVGNYGLSQKKIGEEFEISKAVHFSENWMEALEEIPKVDKTPKSDRNVSVKATYSPAKKAAAKPAPVAQAESVSDESPL